jgi:uncharacterized OB-fold protein
MSTVTEGFTVGKCAHCGTYYFPRRLICRRCGGDSWNDHIVRQAVIEESTTLMHVTGHEAWGPRHLATVRTGEGLCLVVGLEAPVPDGATVNLADRDSAPIAQV